MEFSLVPPWVFRWNWIDALVSCLGPQLIGALVDPSIGVFLDASHASGLCSGQPEG